MSPFLSIFNGRTNLLNLLYSFGWQIWLISIVRRFVVKEKHY
jgi:hypothetical protein